MAKLIDLTGKRFGRLVVLAPGALHDPTYLRWKVMCDCGNSKEVRGANLRNGVTNSCCCAKKELKGKSYLNKAQPSWLTRVHSEYLQGSARRGLGFELTCEQVKVLCLANCYYCGAEPCPAHGRPMLRNEPEWGSINGIDRRISSLGYSLESCVPCCQTCNRMKMALDEEQFIENILRIAKHVNR